MPQIRIIKAALREIQKLPYSACESVYEILRSLSLGTDTDTKYLEKYNQLRLLRTRKGDVRVIWKEDDNNDILVIKAAFRDKAFVDDCTTRDFGNQELINGLEDDDSEELQLAETDYCQHPAYQWNHEINSDWYKFVFNSYRYSPVRTSYQKEFFDKVFNPLTIYKYNQNKEELNNQACIIQSAPGTGKTVCATLFACEIHRENQWNIMLIVPDALKKDIAKYSEIQQAQMQDSFSLLTFREWLYHINPQFENYLASQEEELKALQEAAKYTPQVRINPSDISYRDVLLYQCFVLDTENQNQARNAVFKENQLQLQKLEKIDKNRWLKGLSGKKSRLDIALELKQNSSLAKLKSGNTLVIIDEAQDFMLCELQALLDIYKAWNQNYPENQTYIWLLGDLNQRIVPTDFNWKQLHLGKPISLEKNYRNSGNIIEFANQFWHLAEKINRQFRGKHLPSAVKPEHAFEVGEKVRVLKCNSKDDALNFLQQLARECKTGENKRHLLHNLANSVKVISNDNLDIFDENLVILNAEDAKGREFEACVAVGLFTGNNEPSLEEAFQWYTLLTRVRSRLLIVITPEELNRLNLSQRNYFENCLNIDSQLAISWITELASDVDISQISNVKQRLLKRCDTGHLYWDTYLALQLAGIEGDELYQWEKDAISRLKKHNSEDLKSELNNIHHISLRCLLWRTMEFSWQAVIEANGLQKTDFNEYQRLLWSVAKDLEDKGFTYEAARIKARIGEDKTHLTFPFWQEISEKSNSSQPLITLLCEAFAYRIENIIEKEVIK